MEALASGSPRVWIVIVTYDAPYGLLERCVRSVLATSGRPTELDDGSTHLVDHVLVVDNGGRAERRLAEADLAHRVEVLDPGRNDGFAAGVNAGCRAAIDAGADIVVVLNDDVEATDGWLPPLLGALQESDARAAVQPVLVGSDDPSVVESAGVVVDRYGAGSDVARGESVAALPAATNEVNAVTGGAMALSVRALLDVGPFDERFFLYYEDVEWCQRASRRGWRFAVVPSSRVRHVGSASTFRLGESIRRLQERNRLWSVAMHGSARRCAAALWLSVRRLRHHPRRVHAAALLGGLGGGAVRVVQRWARSAAHSPRWGRGDASIGQRSQDHVGTSAPAFLRRPLPGVNVAGFHHIDNGLGDAVRLITESLRAAGVDVIEVDNVLTDAPQRRDPRPVPAELHDTTIAVVTAAETAWFRSEYPQLFGPGRRVIGYWFWELETVPEVHRHAFDLVTDVWAPTAFVRDAFAAAAPSGTPVRHAPLRLPAPSADADLVAAWRVQFGDTTTFLVSFDYFSIPERKNPQAAIRAFVEAFPARSDVSLIVKSQNSWSRPEYAASVRQLAADDGRVRFIDEHLDEAEHVALLAAVDCLVSPHRSEGLGLQPAQAMALGTSVITTAYGGVTDYCTAANSILVPFEYVGVVDGEGIYPSGTPWADIDHGALVAAFQQVADDSALRERLSKEGNRTIDRQPDPVAFGRAYVDLATTLDLRRRSALVV